MSGKFRPVQWLVSLSACLVFVGSGLWIAEGQQSSNFTGKVTPVTENSEANIAHFRFEPGARTRWHSHGGGQIILVEEGVGLNQFQGGPITELHAGETIYCPPGVVHWHGAAPDRGGVQFNVTRGEIKWGEHVTEAEYTAKPQR
jgi:quercetin dioxygenase-like cupin family protein